MIAGHADDARRVLGAAQAIDILRVIESSHPEAKDQIEAAIRQVQP